jgi:hypothetical protein
MAARVTTAHPLALMRNPQGPSRSTRASPERAGGLLRDALFERSSG